MKRPSVLLPGSRLHSLGSIILVLALIASVLPSGNAVLAAPQLVPPPAQSRDLSNVPVPDPSAWERDFMAQFTRSPGPVGLPMAQAPTPDIAPPYVTGLLSGRRGYRRASNHPDHRPRQR